MESAVKIEDALAAHKQAKDAVEALRTRHRSLYYEMIAASAGARRHETSYLPREEMNALLAEGLHRSFLAHAQTKIEGAIQEMLTQDWGVHSKPPGCKRAQEVLGGDTGVGFSEKKRPMLFNLEMMYVLCADTMRERLLAVIGAMPAQCLGYDLFEESQIAPNREERIQLQEKWSARADELAGEMQQIVYQLQQFGEKLYP